MQRLTLEKDLEQEGEPGPERRPDGSPGEIRAPTLVVVGDQDQPQILAAAERYVTEIPGAERVVIAGAAHIPNLERPDEFDDIVLRFLLGLPQGPIRP
jgi:pimeloyl-ACP methyl ester carboxylesterase